MHGSFNVGMIDLSTGKYPELIDAIRQFCEALASGDRAERIQYLRKLTRSDNKVLRENAEYAIEHFVPEADPRNAFLTETHERSAKLLEKAILENDVDTIRKALQGRFLSIKSRAVQALTKLDDKASIPNLVQLLKTNQGLIDGGSEIQYEQNLLNKVIVLGLEKLADAKFETTEKLLKIEGKGYSPLSPEDIQEIEEKIANLDLKNSGEREH
jgi:hypothetical protein